MDRKLIYILLFIVIISAGVLIHKINSKPKYDKEVYDQVYKEYEEIISNKNEQENLKEENDNTIEIYQNARGISYRVIATISIPKINVHLPIISTTSDELLEIAPTKFFGPEVNQIGNFCITGHNLKSDKHFSNLSKLEINDIVKLADRNNNELIYKVYDKYEVYETDLSCTSQDTNEQIELTLITCTKNSKKRLVVKCVASE